MKTFSKKWKSSKNPSKQRKFRAKAPIHIKKSFLNVNLSKELKKKYAKRNALIRKGDVVKVLRGRFKGKSGKIILVDLINSQVFIEGMQKDKRDGTKVGVNFNPSNLQIIEITSKDKLRTKSLERNIKK